jgi:biotin synthase-like enzyme
MKELQVDSIVIMPLKPMPYTEMEKYDPPNMYQWAKTVAIATIFMEQADIFTNPDQAAWGIRAGANAFFPVYRSGEMEEILQMRRQANNVPDELVKSF